MKKKEDSMAVLRKALGKKTLVIGKDLTMKKLAMGKIKRVFIASNCLAAIVEDINHYAGLADIEVIRLEMPNDELGVFCKKPFPISVISE